MHNKYMPERGGSVDVRPLDRQHASVRERAKYSATNATHPTNLSHHNKGEITGLLIGSMFGGFFLRGYRRWPMYIGGGLGFGRAYSNCEDSLNTFLLSKEPRPCVIK
ncbi:hypothetical protein RR46_00699 [Papilio xuthus]|uniref:MICOS complex subunit MIC10 n=1 Tax=Papilio xuthus TaxID=66420 RepID=A0A0N1PGJ8_PAPXU|nr:hypothetical protein RR46_00699 [Papilio xuthus]